MDKSRRRRRYAVPISALFILLAAIGLVTVIYGSVRLTRRAFDNSSELSKISETVRPLVMWDPVPFESPDDIESSAMLYYSMWAAIMENRGRLALDEDSQSTIVPVSDVDVAAANLFGRDIEIQHRTFGELDTTYYYDENRNVYLVPTVSLYVYSPMVDSLEKGADGYYYARIGYLAPSGAYTVNYQGDQGDPEPEKYMIYVLEKSGSDYYVRAVRFEDQQGETVPPAETSRTADDESSQADDASQADETSQADESSQADETSQADESGQGGDESSQADDASQADEGSQGDEGSQADDVSEPDE